MRRTASLTLVRPVELEVDAMAVSAGDRIVVESEKVGQQSRAGVVEEVLQEHPQRLRVRWDDGRTTIFSPSSGAARFTSGSKKKQR
jgi:hypothetical protein